MYLNIARLNAVWDNLEAHQLMGQAKRSATKFRPTTQSRRTRHVGLVFLELKMSIGSEFL